MDRRRFMQTTTAVGWAMGTPNEIARFALSNPQTIKEGEFA
jgi:hypothetical protein